MKENMTSPVGVGIISIITVLLVLVLAIFSCLTLSTAQADYALSQRGAETVQSYYEADGEARRMYAAFLQGEEAQLEAVVPMDELQGLRIHLLRLEDGETQVLAWQTVLIDEFSEHVNRYLPVWTGEVE